MLTTTNPMLLAGLLALDSHITQHGENPAEAVGQLPYARSYPTDFLKSTGVYSALADMQVARDVLHCVRESTPQPSTQFIIGLANKAVYSGLRAMLCGVGCTHTMPDKLVMAEAGRLVVRNAFPRALSCYGAGSFGDFSVHRLPLQGFVVGVHNAASEQVHTQKTLAQALLAVRKRTARITRQQVQANPNTAIRDQQTGAVLSKWQIEHWQQITWRLGYSTIFNLFAQAAEQAGDEPAPAELLPALLRIVGYFEQVFYTYLQVEQPDDDSHDTEPRDPFAGTAWATGR